MKYVFEYLIENMSKVSEANVTNPQIHASWLYK